MMTPDALERVRERCIVDGPHWLWKGAVNSTGMPIMRWQGACRMVRRVVVEARDNRAPKRTVRATPNCDQKACVSPHCLICCEPRAIILRESARGVLHTPERLIRSMLTRRANSRISEEAVQRMRASTETTAAIAAAEGVHPSYVNYVRRGVWRRDLRTPWAGLMP